MDGVYSGPGTEAEKRAGKQAAIERLPACATREFARPAGKTNYSGHMPGSRPAINNASLAATFGLKNGPGA